MNIEPSARALKGLNSLRDRHNAANKTTLTVTQYTELVVEGIGAEEMDRQRITKREAVKEFADLFADATKAKQTAALAALA
jgi:hypothetical protein